MPQRRAGHGQSAPMLPLVISTTGMPGLSRPSARAASRMALAARSFTLPPGCRNSALATSRPGPAWIRSNEIRGVFPIKSSAEVARMSVPVHGRRGGPASRTEIVGNASAGVVSRRSAVHRRFDPRHRRRVQPGQQIQRAQVLAQLRHAGRAQQHRAHVRIAQRPRNRQLRARGPQLIGHVARARRPASPPGGRRRRNP